MRRKIVHTKQLKGKQKQRKIEKALKVLKVFEYTCTCHWCWALIRNTRGRRAQRLKHRF